MLAEEGELVPVAALEDDVPVHHAEEAAASEYIAARVSTSFPLKASPQAEMRVLGVWGMATRQE